MGFPFRPTENFFRPTEFIFRPLSTCKDSASRMQRARSLLRRSLFSRLNLDSSAKLRQRLISVSHRYPSLPITLTFFVIFSRLRRCRSSLTAIPRRWAAGCLVGANPAAGVRPDGLQYICPASFSTRLHTQPVLSASLPS